MKMPNQAGRYTYQDWLKWEGRWELIDGKPYNMTPAPSWEHQYIVGELHFALRAYFGNKACYVAVAPFDVYLSAKEDYDHPDHVLQPDLSVICNPNQLASKGCYGPPTLVVEVLSPATALKDRNEKLKLYQQFGVQEYWIVDPGYKMVEVLGLEDGYYRTKEAFGKEGQLRSFIFKDLTINLKPVFQFEQDKTP
ncbi:Uma2 family endonuclease [Caldalkalibacillus uzonensis]|uniref:Uma2 family endonuclease n=2 Tax=Caldalkalibacillus uzonensis TaxID=353224 RepID=A0ABU0CQY4_9BACI|nr:Uma2 family endonuclease [Caldalkalibacillus uzonensis]